MGKNLKATDSICDLARHDLLDELSGPQLVVYLRLVAWSQGAKKPIAPTNAELYRRDPRTAVKALRHLEEIDLVRIEYDVKTRPGRTIVLR